jgi:ankyrin repeat protein
MKRKLRRHIKIDRKKLEQRKAETEFKNKKEENFTIVHTEEEFNEKCRQNPDNDKVIHYFIPNQNHLLWQKSNGPISTLNKFIIKNEECEEIMDEEEIFHKSSGKVLIISTEPGMGKSLILDHFTLKSSAENFFIKITLNSCTKTLSDLNSQKTKLENIGDLIEFVLKSLLQKKEEKEIEMLKNFAQEERLILMFDGLDEVNDYKEQVIQLIDALGKDEKYRIKKILITTRNHLKQELEDHFRTFAFNLNNFSDEDQKNFLFKYWRSSNLKRHERAASAKLKRSADDLITKLKSILSESINELIGIPLQTKMMADIFLDNEKDFSKIEITNYAELYHHFIETMVEVNFVNRKQIDPNKNQGLFKREKNTFYLDHIKLSSNLLFENNNETSLEEFNDEEKIQEILEYGVVVAFTENKTPTFLHQSFAEFFLAKSSFTKIEQNKEDDKELEQILRDERHFLIRKFLNDLMENSPNEKKQKESKNKKDKDFNREIENCCRENLISLLKYFFVQKGANLNNENIFLTIASEHGHKVIVGYLIENGIDVNQQDKYGQTALWWASENGHKEIVKLLLDHKEIKVNQQDEDGRSALMRASRGEHLEVVQLLLDHKDIDVNQQEHKDGRTALFEASETGHKEIVQLLLQHKDIHSVNKKDNIGCTALHWASLLGHKETVQLLLGHKDIDVNSRDNKENTALIFASFNGHSDTVRLLLNHKDIEVNHQALGGHFALRTASIEGRDEVVQLLLCHKDIQVNQQSNEGSTALMSAVYVGHKEIVQLLLKHWNIQINQQDNSGLTALILASRHGRKEIVQLLLEHKDIDLNQHDNCGATALHSASDKGHVEVVQLLLIEKEIKINQLNNKGQTALFVASEQGHNEVVQLLLDRKDIHDLNQHDNYGETALHWACENGHTEVVQLLLEKMEIPK